MTATGALRGPAEPDLSRPAPERSRRRRADPAQARGPEPHRCAQDQQHHRPALLAARMGKKRIIAETGAGQHGVASATVAARLGLECVVYMGATDIERQKINVYRMKLLGATVVPVTSGSATLKDALNEAMRDWVTNVQDTFYIIGTVAGPDPYPRMVRDFNAIVGREAREQMLAEYGRLPDAITACVGGGSNAIGLFHAFLNDRRSRSSAPKPPVMASVPVAMPPPSRQAAPACCTATARTCCATMTARSSRPIRCRPARTIRASARSTRSGRYRPRALPRHHRRGSAAGLPSAGAYRGHPARAGIQPCAGTGNQAGA